MEGIAFSAGGRLFGGRGGIGLVVVKGEDDDGAGLGDEFAGVAAAMRGLGPTGTYSPYSTPK